jgi:hypothetical protein
MLASFALVLCLYVVERIFQTRRREHDEVARLLCHAGAGWQKPRARGEAYDRAEQRSATCRI